VVCWCRSNFFRYFFDTGPPLKSVAPAHIIYAKPDDMFFATMTVIIYTVNLRNFILNYHRDPIYWSTCKVFVLIQHGPPIKMSSSYLIFYSFFSVGYIGAYCSFDLRTGAVILHRIVQILRYVIMVEIILYLRKPLYGIRTGVTWCRVKGTTTQSHLLLFRLPSDAKVSMWK